MSSRRIAFVSGGVSAESMIAGLLARNIVSAEQVLVRQPREDRREVLRARFGVTTEQDNAVAAGRADLVCLTIKPQVLSTELRQLAGQLRADQLVISVFAGTSFRVFTEDLDHRAVARVMPNTPAQVGEGITVR